MNTPDEMLSALAGEYAAYRLLATLTSSLSKKRRSLEALEHTYRECVRAVVGTRAAGRVEEASAWRRVQEFARAQRDEMRMWISLREQRFHAAWEALVSAQYAAHFAARWLPDFAPAQDIDEHLAAVERTIFPKQRFLSPGFISDESQAECTLCHAVAGECDHIPGEIYAGEVAARNIRGIVAMRELSLVDNPANKHARVFRYENMDTLTLERIGSASPDRSPAGVGTRIARRGWYAKRRPVRRAEPIST